MNSLQHLPKDTEISVNSNSKSCGYRLGKENFKTWGDVRARAKQIISQGQGKLKGKDFLFAIDLLSYHPYCKEKTEQGVAAIKVGSPNFGKGFCFVVIDNNGKEEDFSHYKCTPKRDKEKAKSSAQIKQRLECYRYAIWHQIIDFKDSVGTVTRCAICKENFYEIKKNNKKQVDHKSKSFVTIVSEFETQYKPKEYPPTKRCDDSVSTIAFCTEKPGDLFFVNSWQKYHRDNADFQIVCAGCNMRKQDGSRYKPYIN